MIEIIYLNSFLFETMPQLVHCGIKFIIYFPFACEGVSLRQAVAG